MRKLIYERKNRLDDPIYTFYELENAVQVTREQNGQIFEHTFHIGEKVQGRTLKNFGLDDAVNYNQSVYASSEEFSKSNRSITNQHEPKTLNSAYNKQQ